MNLYNNKEVAAIEAKRMEEQYLHPLKISKKLLGRVKGKTILDISAGSNTRLNKWIGKKRGNYVAVDNNQEYLDKQAEVKGAKTYFGDVTDEETLHRIYRIYNPTITHIRFLLVHLGNNKNVKAKQALIWYAVSSSEEKTILIEHDWHHMYGSKYINEFKKLAFEFCSELNMDLGVGFDLFELTVKSSIYGNKLDFTQKTFERRPGHYYNELLPLIEVLINRSLYPEFARYNPLLEDLKIKIIQESQDPKAKFTPPPICTLVVRDD